MRDSRCFIFGAIQFICVGLVSAGSIVEDWSAKKGSYDLHAVSPLRFEIQNDYSSGQRKVARFTVMPGDSFRKTTGEHSEVVLGTWRDTSPFRVTGKEGVEYYRISVRLNDDWKSPERNAQGFYWGSFLQLHGPNEYRAPPAIALHAEDEFTLFILAGNLENKAGGRRTLKRSNLNLGRWVDFVLAVNWSPDISGWVAVYRSDEGENGWEKVVDISSTPTLQFKGSDPIGPHYWKAGFYRSESRHANTLWLGPIVRTNSFEEATRK